MKIMVSASSAALVLVALLSAVAASNLRSSDLEGEMMETISKAIGESNCRSSSSSESTCTSTKDSETNEACVWCNCQAVPPICVSPEESKSLPSGVYQCDSSNEDASPRFDLPGGKYLQLRETVNEAGSEDADFCDGSSKSISGYMDLKGSKVGSMCRWIVFGEFREKLLEEP